MNMFNNGNIGRCIKNVGMQTKSFHPNIHPHASFTAIST